jgi:hypothetical protein
MMNDEGRMMNGGLLAQRVTAVRCERWLWAMYLEAEEWRGCFVHLEEAVADAMRSGKWEPGGAVFVALGRKLTAAECAEWGVEWPWYEVEPRGALRVEFCAVEKERRAPL